MPSWQHLCVSEGIQVHFIIRVVVANHEPLSEACPQRLLPVYGEERQVERLLIVDLALPIFLRNLQTYVQLVQDREFLQLEISLMR